MNCWHSWWFLPSLERNPNSHHWMSNFFTKQSEMMERKGLSVQLRRQSNEAKRWYVRGLAEESRRATADHRSTDVIIQRDRPLHKRRKSFLCGNYRFTWTFPQVDACAWSLTCLRIMRFRSRRIARKYALAQLFSRLACHRAQRSANHIPRNTAELPSHR